MRFERSFAFVNDHVVLSDEFVHLSELPLFSNALNFKAIKLDFWLSYGNQIEKGIDSYCTRERLYSIHNYNVTSNKFQSDPFNMKLVCKKHEFETTLFLYRKTVNI
ncbi:hypothetical protein ABEB36_008084, partial [Hypothenemus hampei]